MDKSLRYVNSAGEEIAFASDSTFHYTGATVHDYAHSYATNGRRITRFYDDMREYELDVVMSSGSPGMRDTMTDIFEHDIAAKKCGRLYSGDYYIECYVVASDKSIWWADGGYMRAKLSVIAEDPRWIREDFQICLEGTVGGTGIDYEYDWSFDYVSNVMINSVVNDGVAPAPFVMQAYGPMSHPFHVRIGDTVYSVDVTPNVGEILRIDSRNKTIVLVSADGSEENVFSKRVGVQRKGSGEYIFEDIAPGDVLVVWDADFTFDITVYGNRPEPRWDQ